MNRRGFFKAVSAAAVASRVKPTPEAGGGLFDAGNPLERAMLTNYTIGRNVAQWTIFGTGLRPTSGTIVECDGHRLIVSDVSE